MSDEATATIEYSAETKTLGDQIVALADARRTFLQVLRKDVKEIDEIIDERLQKAIDRTAPEAMKKLEKPYTIHSFHECRGNRQ